MDIIDLRKLRPPDEIPRLVRGLMVPVLAPLSLLYGAGAWVRRRLPARVVDPGIPVISVGSIAAGGTGKTPICMYVAERLQAAGARVCIISRGYRRRSKISPLVVSDGQRMLATLESVGDEPYMMARRLEGVGVVVSADRVQAAIEAERVMNPTALVLDDGFQYRNIRKHVEVVCFDWATLRGRSMPLPLGTLREGWSAIRPEHLVVIVVPDGEAKPAALDLGRLSRCRIFYATRSRPTYVDRSGEPVGDLKQRRLVLLSGIARPAAFEVTCSSAGLNPLASIRFDDHHWYDAGDAGRIGDIMKRYACETLLTTEKDVHKLPEEIAAKSVVVRTDIVMEDAGRFAESLDALRG
jgi:tetraacyldisaccharide 4'-kinase